MPARLTPTQHFTTDTIEIRPEGEKTTRDGELHTPPRRAPSTLVAWIYSAFSPRTFPVPSYRCLINERVRNDTGTLPRRSSALFRALRVGGRGGGGNTFRLLLSGYPFYTADFIAAFLNETRAKSCIIGEQVMPCDQLLSHFFARGCLSFCKFNPSCVITFFGTYYYSTIGVCQIRATELPCNFVENQYSWTDFFPKIKKH